MVFPWVGLPVYRGARGMLDPYKKEALRTINVECQNSYECVAKCIVASHEFWFGEAVKEEKDIPGEHPSPLLRSAHPAPCFTLLTRFEFHSWMDTRVG